MDLIEEFITRYRKEFDYYDQAARLVSQLLLRNLQSAGIRGMVTYRAKSPIRLKTKVLQRMPDKSYKNLNEIYDDIVDLAGVRVALYFPGENKEVERIIYDLFRVEQDPKRFPRQSREDSDVYKKKFSGYAATHYRVHLRDHLLNDIQRRYAEALVEIQVASVLMLAWAEVEHDLLYKPMQGNLSKDECAILDEVNGLVLAGEIALERLQTAGEARINAKGHKFTNHYELAAYILDFASKKFDQVTSEMVLGRIDLLYDFLQKLDYSTPDALEPYLQTLSSNTERRPLADQIIDQLLSEDGNRYEIFDDLRYRNNRSLALIPEDQLIDKTVQAVIGNFLTKWILFERLVRDIGFSNAPNRQGLSPINQLLRSNILDEDTMKDFIRIRRLRNNLIHGIEIPDVSEIQEATEQLDIIIQEISNKNSRDIAS